MTTAMHTAGAGLLGRAASRSSALNTQRQLSFFCLTENVFGGGRCTPSRLLSTYQNSHSFRRPSVSRGLATRHATTTLSALTPRARPTPESSFLSTRQRTNHVHEALIIRCLSTSTIHNNSSNAAEPSTTPEKKPLIPGLKSLTTHENIYTIPNILTFSRLLASPAIGYFILHHASLPALCLFAYAGFTDAIDGYLARRYNQQTVVGTVIDPMADKILMTTCVVTLALNGTFPLWLAVIILGRDVGLAISAIYFRWISLPPPKTMARYWDFSLPSAEVHPTEISKINTFLQLLLVGNAVLLPCLPETVVEAWNLWGVMEGWFYLVGGTTVWSGLSYVGNKNAVKILSHAESKEKQMGNSNES